MALCEHLLGALGLRRRGVADSWPVTEEAQPRVRQSLA